MFLEVLVNMKNSIIKSKSRLKKIDSNKRKVIPGKEISGIKSNDYKFGKYYDHQYLIYSNNENYCITFKVLD